MKSKNFIDWIGKSHESIIHESVYQEFFKEGTKEQVDNDIYISNIKRGIELVLDQNDIVSHIFFHGDNTEDHASFQDSLPFNLGFKKHITAIEKDMNYGKVERGGGEILPILGVQNNWIKFKFDNKYVHLRFDEEDLLVRLAVGIPC